MQTTNHSLQHASDSAKSRGTSGIVGGIFRVYTEEEKAAAREKFTAEVTAEFAGKLENVTGWRKWWLEWRMTCEIDSRTHRFLYGGI